MSEVELMDTDYEARELSDAMKAVSLLSIFYCSIATQAFLQFRDAVINQSTGTVTLDTRYHFDSMVKDFAVIFVTEKKIISFGLQRRASRMRRHYYYTAITSTPFTLVVSLPDKYGASKVHGVEEIRRSLAEGEIL
jgi:hypothetical protein